MGKITKAIISVTDKTGIVDFAKSLAGFQVEILSTGGTARALRGGGVFVTDISAYTGFPEMMDGRVKTLHPKVHGGLLGLRDNPEHVKVMAEHGIEGIDLVVVNLYQFEKTVSREGVTLEEAIENIDIGGPSMLRSAAKNFKDVTVIVDPDDYGEVLREMDASSGETLLSTRFRLARKVFRLTHEYDGAISRYLSEQDTVEIERAKGFSPLLHRHSLFGASFFSPLFSSFHGTACSCEHAVFFCCNTWPEIRGSSPTHPALPFQARWRIGSSDHRIPCVLSFLSWGMVIPLFT